MNPSRYLELRSLLLTVEEDSSAIRTLLSSLEDGGAAFVAAGYAELRRLLGDGRLGQAEDTARLIGRVLEVQEGGADDELAENRIHRESMRWVTDGISAILSRDQRTGITLLGNVTDAVYCNDSLQWVAWLWLARAAADIGDLAHAQTAAREAHDLTEEFDPAAVGATLCTMGEIEMLREDHKSALAHLGKAVEMFENVRDARGLATALLGQARAHVAAGHLRAGVEAAARAAEATPQWSAPVVFLAWQALKAGDPDRAEKVLRRLPDDESASNDVARALHVIELVRGGRVATGVVRRYLELCDELPSEDLVEELRELAAAHPHFYYLRELLAWTLAKLDRDEEAQREFAYLVQHELVPELHSSVLLGLGCLADRAHRHRQPGARVRAAASARPTEPSDEEDDLLVVESEPVSAEEAARMSNVASGVSAEFKRDRKSQRSSGASDSGIFRALDPPTTKAVFTGELQLFAVPDLLEFLKSSRRTGTLVVTSDSGIGAVHMRQGAITGAAAPECDNIGKLLLDRELVDEPQLQSAMTRQSETPDRLLGEILVETGVLDAETVKRSLVQQVYGAIRQMVGWTSGHFAFEPDKHGLQVRDDISIELDTQAVLLDVLRQVDEENR